MVRRAKGHDWEGFTEAQGKLLDALDDYGNNGWARNSQAEFMLPVTLEKCAKEGLTIEQVTEAMKSLGYNDRQLHQLQRWENKRLTGKFGR